MPIKQRFAMKQTLPQSLADLLVNPVQLGHFRSFLLTEFSQENLDFILDVDKFVKRLYCAFTLNLKLFSDLH